MKDNYINNARVSVEEIVENLYTFSNPGMVSIPNVLTKNALGDLISVARSNTELFRVSQRKVGDITQEMSTLYFEDIDPNSLKGNAIGILRKLTVEYTKIYQEIARQGKFSEMLFNSVGYHSYPSKSIGITPHRDFKSHRDLISIFNLVGSVDLYYCEDSGGQTPTRSQNVDCSPGTLVLLRAPRSSNEDRYRPMHYIPQTNDERLSINFRNKSNLDSNLQGIPPPK